jgi:peptide/nickel transport system substrate-binding protein
VTPANRYYLNLPLVPFDLPKANALLEGDGWKRGPDGVRAKAGRRLSLTLTSSIGSPDLDTEIELIRGMWKQIGVDFVVKRYLASQYFATVANGGIINAGKFDVAIFGWGSDPNEDMSNLYACYRFPPNGQNDMRWCDPAATAAMDRAKESYDPQVRKIALAQVQRAVYDEVPTVIRDVRKLLAVYNDDLRNWHPNSVGPFDDMMKVDI